MSGLFGLLGGATTQKKAKEQKTSVHVRAAMFALAVFLFATTLIPPLSAYAAVQQQAAAVDATLGTSDNPQTNPHIAAAPANTPMKTNYAGPLGITQSNQPGAADAQAVDSVLSQLTKKEASLGETIQTQADKPKITPHELTNKRTATTSVTQNADGTFTRKQYFSPQFYKKDNAWAPIDTTLTEDTNAGDATNTVTKLFGLAESLFTSPTNYTVTANDWQARFAPSDFDGGMVRIKKGDSQIGFSPVNAKAGVAPVITKTSDGKQVVHYYDLWPGVNVDYVVTSDSVKENIILKTKDATNQVAFTLIGANLQPQKVAEGPAGYDVTGALGDDFSISPINLILNNFGFVTDSSVYKQSFRNGVLTTSVSKDYLQALPAKAFPAVIDPTLNSYSGNRAGGTYMAYKSDGYKCYSGQCNIYSGTLYDVNGYLQDWQGAMYVPYSQISGNALQSAKLHLWQRSNESFWTGTWDTHSYGVGRRTCDAYNCIDGVWAQGSVVNGQGLVDLTNFYRDRMNNNDYNAWLMIAGMDNSDSTYKNFDPEGTYVEFNYTGVPTAPTFVTPSEGQVYTDPQASFTINLVTAPDGSNSLQYEMLISSAPGASGVVASSGLTSSRQWTAPDGMLQDGTTYYIQARSYDPSTLTYSPWGGAVSFKIDMRTGKDKTQTFDSLGPIDADLATGNVTTSASSHTTTALGGTLGVNLNYNSTVKSRPGLVGEYWNVAANYTGAIPSTAANLTRVDPSVDFDWQTSGPDNTLQSDWFMTRWSGYFVAPVAGTYYLGGTNDDKFTVFVDNNQVSSSVDCAQGGAVCYGTPVTLTAGQVVPLRVEYQEYSGLAYAHLFVKGPVAEQVMPGSWLQTGPRTLTGQHGLTGHYYNDDGNHNLDSTTKVMYMQRVDPLVSFDWSTGSAVPGGPTDNFMTRWSGYFTAPVTGSYQFGTKADDGSRVTVNGTQLLNNWQDTPNVENWGGSVSLTAGQSVPIIVDYYEHGGSADIALKVKGAVPSQIVPTAWLSPKAQVLPDGWSLGIDADGNLSYDHLKANQNSAVLTDSSGDTHEYKWTGTAYKPPVNEDGSLVRNSDGTFTLTDSDGRTYNFATDGTLTLVTNPVDDRHPAALQYTYQSINGGPSAIKQISDGVDPSRNLTVYYSGDSNCTTPPAGFDIAAPSNMLCAVKTNDGRVTSFYYSSGQLARISKPGNENTDYGYEAVSANGNVIGYRINSIRDSLANDAIAAGVRANDATTNTTLSYDVLGRVVSVTQPAATAGATQTQHTIEYLPGALDKSYFGATQQHIVGSAEPNGFTRRVEYDNLFRTQKDTDVAGLSATTKWDALKDLQYSTTDPTGLTSTTIYDDEDRPQAQYGPAPSSWFTTTQNAATGHTDITPASAYASQVPHSDVTYDGGITGPSVAWYNTRVITNSDGSTSPAFYGAPKLHTTNILPTDPNEMGRNFMANPAPISVDSGNDNIGYSATGKIVFPQTGTYTIKMWHDDGARLFINDRQIFAAGDWNYVGETQMISANTVNVIGGQPYRFRLDFANRNAQFAEEAWLAGPGIADTSGQGLGTNHWGTYIRPDYNLPTSSTTYDATLGNSTTTTNYGSTPELGLAQSASVDPSGLNLTSTSTYETQGASGSYLRQTSKTLPGGATTNYTYYGATETVDNPCTTGTVEAYKQGGMIKLKTEPDPDGSGSQTGRAIETIYDDAGKVVATRMNSDPWTCTTYDSQERPLTTTVPSLALSKVNPATGATGTSATVPARTITNNYAVGGNPLVTSTSDSSGTITVTTDLLGRNVQYVDAKGNTTTSTYDSQGHLATRTSPLGTETFTYDNYDRLTDQILDGVTYAHVTYDAYSRIATVTYPGNQSLSSITRDDLGRVNSTTFTLANGSTVSDSVTRATTGDILSGTENGTAKSYTYDKAGRLTAATIGSNTYSYTYGTQNSTCGVSPGNVNSGKDSNRTSQTINGVTTTYCYDQADRLVTSSNAAVTNPSYDSHGNTTKIGSTNFTYDSSDRNSSISEGTKTTTYTRDVQGRVIGRVEVNGTTTTNSYGFTASGDSPDFLTDASNAIQEKYLTLPGNVLVTIRPTQTGTAAQMFSLPNLHGDVTTTTDGTGTKLADFSYDPFGNKTSTSLPTNTGQGTTYGWLGQHQKQTETDFTLSPTQMGARVYLASIGRFLQVDPIEGGTPNNYVYPPDPVNDFDLDGNMSTAAKWGVGILGAAGVAAACYFGGCEALAASATVRAVVAVTGPVLAKVTAWTPRVLNRVAAWRPRVLVQTTQRAVSAVGRVNTAVGRLYYNSTAFGRKSVLYGAKRLGARISGKLNNNNLWRIGWNVHNGQKVLRIAFGPSSWKWHPHFDLLKGKF